MARVPLTERSVKTGGPVNASINVQTTADMFGARTGRNLKELGVGLNDAATELQAISLRVVERENKQNVRNALSTYTEGIRKWKAEVLSQRKGEDAKGLTSETALHLKEQEEQLRSTLTNQYAIDEFDQKIGAIRDGFLDTTSTYEQSEFAKAELESMESLNITYIESAAEEFQSEENIKTYKNLLLVNINDIAAKQGWSVDKTREVAREQLTKMHVAIINNLSEFDATKARDYFNKAKKADEITGDVYDDINKVIKAGDTLSQAYSAFDRITADGTDSTKWDAEAKKLDPEVRAKVETMISNKRTRDTALATAATKAHTENAIRSILAGREPSLVDSIKGDSAKIQKFQDWHDKRQDRTTQEGNIRLYVALYRKDQDFADMNIEELLYTYGPGVGKTDFEKIIKHHAAVKEGLAKNIRWAQSDVELFMERNSKFFGMTDLPNDKDKTLQANFKEAMYDEIENYRNANNGEEPNREWVNTTATRLMTERFESKDWQKDPRVRQFQVTDKEEHFDISKESIPSPNDFHPQFIEHARSVYLEGLAAKNKPTADPRNVFASRPPRKVRPMPDQYVTDLWKAYVTNSENMTYTGPLLKRE